MAYFDGSADAVLAELVEQAVDLECATVHVADLPELFLAF